MNFVPYDKLSKKKKRALDRARRGSWGGISPVTRRSGNPKAYKRNKLRLSDEGEAELVDCGQTAGKAAGALSFF